MTAALEVRALTRRRDDTTVVDAVDLVVEQGELLALVGPSGCGKSTLLRVIAGLEPAADGTVVLGGRDVTTMAAEQRGITLVFQDNALFGHLRVDRNIAFGLRHLPRRERSVRVREMLELVQLTHVARRYPHELSGGEQQRIALARALAPRPALVLLDEPFANLDETLRDDLRTDVTDLLASLGTAAILVTHDRDEALSLGHRVAVMRDGRILQCGTPEDVYARPVDRFVASFLAPTSLLPEIDGTASVARPGDLVLRAGGQAEVVDRVYLGSAHRYAVRRSDGVVVLVDQRLEPPLQVGEACEVAVADGRALHRVT